jgi:hypothetical protein
MSSAPHEPTYGRRVRMIASEALRAARHHAADDLVGDLGRAHVDHAGEQARVGELLHRLAARPGRVEHEAVVFLLERLRHRLHARRRVAEHREADRLARGASAACGARAPAMHDHAARAWAALASTCSLMRLMPATSVTE